MWFKIKEQLRILFCIHKYYNSSCSEGQVLWECKKCGKFNREVNRRYYEQR